MYKLKKVVKDYPKGRDVVHALRGVNLEIADGEWLSIQGPTGHGKSTLLQLLGGLDRPTSGSLELNGQRPGEARRGRDDQGARQLDRVHLPDLQPDPDPVGAGERRDGAGTARRSATRRGSRARPRRSPRSGSPTGPGTCPSELSGGQQQRVAIARALVKEPKVLLADEPTGNLDEDTRDEIIALLEKLWQDNGLTMVMVTHDSTVARRAQRLGTMRNGQLTVKQTVK